jgi:hypothetical protein
MTWFEWLWTVASVLVLIDTPIGIYMYYHTHQKGKEDGK